MHSTGGLTPASTEGLEDGFGMVASLPFADFFGLFFFFFLGQEGTSATEPGLISSVSSPFAAGEVSPDEGGVGTISDGTDTRRGPGLWMVLVGMGPGTTGKAEKKAGRRWRRRGRQDGYQNGSRRC
jgi:hypothetical protein